MNELKEAVRIAKLSYKGKQCRQEASELGYSVLKHRTIKKTDTNYSIVYNRSKLWISVCGTESKQDIINDLDLSSHDPIIKKIILKKKNGKKWYDEYKKEIDILKDLKKIYGLSGVLHFGFFRCAVSMYDDLVNQLTSLNVTDINISGHSLGAGVGTILAYLLDMNGYNVNSVYLFGSPRVGGKKFTKKYNKKLGKKTFRFTNDRDGVCRVPFFIMGFRHVKKGYYISSNGNIRKYLGIFKDFLSWKTRFNEVADDHFINSYIKAIG